MEHTLEHSIQHGMGSHDNVLVLISYLIAVVASYNVLDLTSRINKASGKSRWLWLFFGAIIMGMGIWSMHFVGMMAMSLPFPVSYDLVIVLISVAVAIVASFVALLVVSRQRLPLLQLLGGACLFALGIVLMHYIGMYAMQVEIRYDPMYVMLSIMIACAASITALWLSLYFLKSDTRHDVWKKVGSALIMGGAIAGMHYTGMMAAHIESDMPPNRVISSLNTILDQKRLAYFISMGTLFTLGLSIVGLYISRLFSKQESEKQENEKWYKSLYEHNQDGIISIDLHMRIVGINPAAARIGGIKEKQLKDQSVSTLLTMVVEEDRERIRHMFVRATDGEEMKYETVIYSAKQERVELGVVLAPVIVDEQVVGNYIIMKDITDEKRVKVRNYHLAFHDELTGLPNRRMFNQRLSETIESHRYEQKQFAVMVLDLDRFKVINDSLGHIYGDLFLQEMSRRIKDELNGEDVTLARMGGDEFAILVHQYTSLGDITRVAERIIQAIAKPCYLKESEFYVTGSIGIAVFPDHGQDAVELLQHADTAMYEVKKNGKNGYQFFSAELHHELRERMVLENDLRKALDRGEFVLHYQPQIQTSEVSMIGVEALVRWNHPTRGLLYPGTFISVAEETGMIIELGNRVLREACIQMRNWHEAGGPLIPVSVNLSSQQFHQSNLVEQVHQILLETGLSPQYLELEITESMMMDARASIEILNQLTKLGIRISLDDFGTGYSSFSYLKMFPIHKVKIDRSFIQDIAVNHSDRAIVSTMITMAKQLNMDVIAEGIETKGQLDILTEQDCNEVQGYYYSKPLPADEVEQIFFLPQRSGKVLTF
ncbi:EAL domain-containing protein [Paenibacillus sp. LS1]|uniref:bifunctional diguanylate cyclase/phosphodiesterase n=1 Tax=Paenibacillus sp. LS1 TaxID=2992120 RepID=UPI00222E9E8A|nr:bifunctional diguanylate cyclase/phosphodiesterase [Paenibacillus sp. LS1]MCW3794411.1 EAL domain-containing protein [Paenibacillus sp. LS1]